MRLDVIKAKTLKWATCIVHEWNKGERVSHLLPITLNEDQDVGERMIYHQMICGESL
jgi:hypothetical protein